MMRLRLVHGDRIKNNHNITVCNLYDKDAHYVKQKQVG